MPAPDLKAAIERAARDYNDPARRDAYFDLYSEDAIVHGFAGDEIGLGAIRRFYDAYWQAFPDARLSISDLIVDGERAACRFAIEGTHEGSLMGLPPTGRRATLHGITLLRFSGGRCVERWSQVDMSGLLRQLGAAAPAASPS